MDILTRIIAYYCLRYPYPEELSDARLTKMVYLSDWFSSLSKGRQLTNISWYFNHYGPYVDDVYQTVLHNPDIFNINYENNYYGNSKKIIKCKKDLTSLRLDSITRDILDAVIEETQHLYFNNFIDYIYSTYPIAKNDRYAFLDLPYLAQEFKNNNK